MANPDDRDFDVVEEKDQGEPPSNIFSGTFIQHVSFGICMTAGERAATVSRYDACKDVPAQEDEDCIGKGLPYPCKPCTR